MYMLEQTNYQKSHKNRTLEHTFCFKIPGSHGSHVRSPCPPFHCFHSPPGYSGVKLPPRIGENMASKNHPEIRKIRKTAHERSQFQIMGEEKKTQELPSNNCFSCPQISDPPNLHLCWHLSFSPLQRFSITQLDTHVPAGASTRRIEVRHGEGAMLNRKPPSKTHRVWS